MAIGRVLIVAGSDSSGGAGIQADLKTVTALGGYAATAITALTAQNTLGVFGVVGVEPAFIAQQMRRVLEDIGADCLKTGMLHHRCRSSRRWLKRWRPRRGAFRWS
jgi:hydroxymethylpyrimidine/phosphomethylpyrimidine kinase